MAHGVEGVPHQEPISVNLQALVGLFYRDQSVLGQFDEVQPADMPELERKLLAHENHMTVTVESHHQSPVDVLVLDRNVTRSHYARKILLCKQSDHEVVQYGLMRVNYAHLAPEVRAEIEAGETPLGRVLINHNVLRSVQLVGLFRIMPGKELRHFFGIDAESGPPRAVYGRTAMIFCDEEPAVELLEIVAPERPSAGA